jgi:hypothetical protein
MAPIVTTSSRRQKPTPAPLVAILAGLGLAVVLFFALRRPHSTAVPEIESPVAPTVATNGFANTSFPDGGADARQDPAQPARPVSSPKIIRPSSKAPEGERMEIPRAGAVRRAASPKSAVVATNILEYTPPVFDNQMERFLSTYANSATEPQMLMPRFGKDSEAALRQILATDIVVYDDDDASTVTNKERVASLKREIVEAVNEGYSAAEILNQMREDNNRRIKERRKMQRTLNSLLKSNLVDRAVAYFNSANAKLSEDFMPPLDFREDKIPVQE